MQKFRVMDSSAFRQVFLVGLSCLAMLASAENYPQLKLPLRKISFCGHNFIAWVAKNDESRQRGFMNFRPLQKSEAMLFVFDSERPLSFWMKNVPYDLEIAYFNKAKELVSYTTMRGTSPLQKEESLPTYKSEAPSLYAVEVKAGTLQKLPKTCKLVFE